MYGLSIRNHPLSMLDRPGGTPVDPLSDALALVVSRCLFSAVFTAGGDWSIRFSRIPSGIKFGVMLQGQCWLILDGRSPLQLQTGDCYLLTSKRSYVLSSDPELPPKAFDNSLQYGTRTDVEIAGGRFDFEGPGASLLIKLLPQLLHVHAGSDVATALPWVLERLRIEFATMKPGSALMLEHLANIMFVQMLRVYLATAPKDAGWLRALSDETIGEALHRMHREPARRWTVDELAREVGLSRSTFALRFKSSVGAAPLEYLLRWRMQIAEHVLLKENTTIASVAHALSYESESAFSNAFKRVTGIAPSHYRNRLLANGNDG